MFRSAGSSRTTLVGLVLILAGWCPTASAGETSDRTGVPAVQLAPAPSEGARLNPLRFAGAVGLEHILAVAAQSLRGASAAVGGPAETGSLAVLEVDREALGAAASQTHVTLDLPVAPHLTLAVDLRRFDVLTPDAELIAMERAGPRTVARPDIQLWSGAVVGVPDSSVYLAIGPRGADGFVRAGADFYHVSTVPASGPAAIAGRTVAFHARELDRAAAVAPVVADALLAPRACQGALLPPGVVPPTATHPLPPEHQNLVTCRTFRIAVDSDNAFVYLFNGTIEDAIGYVVKLLGAVREIYFRDGVIGLQASYIRVWAIDTESPYNAADTSAQLDQFQNEWLSNAPVPPSQYDLAHLLSGRFLGGGIAYLSVLCNPTFGFGVSANLDGFFPYPILHNSQFNWDLMVFAHELGHNFSCLHTHDMSPPLDGCGSNPQDCTVGNALQGTIMSYCHQCQHGMKSMRMAFGPTMSQVLRNYVQNDVPWCGGSETATDITSIEGPGHLCGGAGGGFAVATIGTSLTYQWYHNGNPVPGQTGQSYSIYHTTRAHAGVYTCVVENACKRLTSPEEVLTICMPDMNCSGTITVQDLFDYLWNWFNNMPKGDYNGSDEVTVQDIFDFLADWFDGIC